MPAGPWEWPCSLGAVDALNLDGGGSTAMAVGGTLVHTTSARPGSARWATPSRCCLPTTTDRVRRLCPRGPVARPGGHTRTLTTGRQRPVDRPVDETDRNATGEHRWQTYGVS
ncbi:phosphodiester glycosidase family protein [Streptomyces himalayensis]|uniref:Phosphodiester glycosidase family protein n=1 Tax=Streptomyces himalayensis subsp. himalayensis TaxID=2756131 RepID=A0A7W0DNH6_9ACTN|nr:phosphodiester glycosidase family protein [Streptomyces himalayensis subsp. himalayensis]